MNNLIIWYLLFYCILVINGSESGPLVKTPLGEIRGFFMKTREGRKIAAFTSIPYALPPIGQLRFKAPFPISQWANVLNATIESPICIQRNPYVHQKEIVGQEDCLFLNVYSPITSNDSNTKHKQLPVMVWIHGGGWMCGDSRTVMYGPEFLLDRDVVYVAANYRLGPLGFLSTQDENCPGNNGLKDQQEALRWVQNNIHSFGGDKNSVTLFGESAGGASAHYHMLSPTSAGLFHKAISQSGTALVPWAEAPLDEPLRNAIKLAKLLDCPQMPTTILIECLRTKDSYDIINTEHSFYTWDYEPMTPFKAVVEPNLPGAFLTKTPREVPDSRSVPWMTGLTKDEGCLKSVWITANETKFNEFSTAFDSIAPITFYYENSPNVQLITQSIRDFYLNGPNGRLTNKDKKGILDIYTDSYFAYPLFEAIHLTYNYTTKPIYLYQLTYRATNSFSQIFGDPQGNYGVCHADDLMHLFPIIFLKKPFSNKDMEMSKLIVILWTNFATTGNPNKPIKPPTEWIPVRDVSKMEYLQIGSDLKMAKHLAERSSFWDKIPLWHKIIPDYIGDELL